MLHRNLSEKLIKKLVNINEVLAIKLGKLKLKRIKSSLKKQLIVKL